MCLTSADVFQFGMTPDHLLSTPTQPQHLVRHCGLAAVQGTQKCSYIAVSNSTCLQLSCRCYFCIEDFGIDIKSAYLLPCHRYFYTEVPALILTCMFLYILSCASLGPPLALVRGIVVLQMVVDPEMKANAEQKQMDLIKLEVLVYKRWAKSNDSIILRLANQNRKGRK